MKRVCVFCGSRVGVRPEYTLAAQQLAQALSVAGLGLVYGGGHVGLMGVLADAALETGCEVIGVIPKALHLREIGHERLSELHIVDSMHARKAKMAELADAFIALPGGLGTLEETFEVWTWAQLGFHRKPVALLDAASFWQPLLTMVERMVSEGFVSPKHRRMLCVERDPVALLERMREWQAPEVATWVREREL